MAAIFSGKSISKIHEALAGEQKDTWSIKVGRNLQIRDSSCVR